MIPSARLDGTAARMAIEGSTGTDAFQACAREAPALSPRPGDIVAMDNLGARKNGCALALIARTGAEVRFLPACSPGLGPIEMTWSKAKALLRKAEERPFPDLLDAIASALNAVTPQDGLGWFAACGYSFT